MRKLRFLGLCLLSQNERKALRVSFQGDTTVLLAGNQMGKSAVVKSLYEAFGAQPHKVDARWRRASVATLLDLSIDGEPHRIVRTSAGTTVLGADDQPLIEMSGAPALNQFWAERLGFGLIMNDAGGAPVVPPPAYIFAPYYIDQDRSWTVTWSSFEGLGLPTTKRTLAEYHIGLKTNAYYEARAKRREKQTLVQKLEARRDALHRALQTVKDALSDSNLTFDISIFRAETDRLLEHARALFKRQVSYRSRLAALSEERRLWLEQRDLLVHALREMRGSLNELVKLPADVICPMCGTHHQNSIFAKFELVKDEDSLIHAAHEAKGKVQALDTQISAEAGKVEEIATEIRNVQEVMTIQRDGIELQDIITAKGRIETERALRSGMAVADAEISELEQVISEFDQMMRAEAGPERSIRVQADFAAALSDGADHLDVVLPDDYRGAILLPDLGRGSETPRALFAYYYAVLQTARRHSSAPLCPIVVDEPDQQGQDDENMRTIMKFIIDCRPPDSQMIIAVEKNFYEGKLPCQIIDLNRQKRSVLSAEMYDEVSELMRPYLGILL